jgi:nitroreductase
MDVQEAIRTMVAVRAFDDRPVPGGIVTQILEAGRLSASASNGQPWHFIVVEERDTLRRLGEIAETGPYIAEAPLAIVVAIPHKAIAASDASRAIQNMLLTAWTEGVGGNWVGFWGLDAAKDFLGIPSELDVLAILPFGYPASPVGKGKKKRKPLAEIASKERFGEPYPDGDSQTNDL